MHPAPVRYAPGHPVDNATIAAFNPVAPRSTSHSRESDLRQMLAERVARWTEYFDHLTTPFRT